MEKQKWSTEQWDERLRLRMLELEQELPESAMDPAAWEAMQAKLAAAQNGAATGAASRKKRFLPWWGSAKADTAVTTPNASPFGTRLAMRLAAAIAGLLILAGLGWGIHQHFTIRALTQQLGENRHPNATPTTSPQQEQPAQEKRGNGAVDPAPILADDKSTPARQSQAEEGASALASRADTRAATHESQKGALEAAAQENAQGPTMPRKEIELPASPARQVSGPAGLPALAAREPGLAAGAGATPVLVLPAAADSLAASLPQEKPAANAKKLPAAHRWSLALSAMPDMSQAGSLSTSRLGGGGGLVLGYQLGNRWRLQAGALFVRKNYAGTGGFTPYGTGGNGYGGGGYGSGSKSLSLNARCHVLDLPLSLQYSFAKVKKVNVYVAGGISSYLMLSERYDVTSSYSSTTYAYRNENRHWFSILNGGIGVATPLGSRLHLQAEPTFRLPLQGVGAGELRLTSFGLQLQVRYGL